jgi:DNA-binding transcriptional MerR regulator
MPGDYRTGEAAKLLGVRMETLRRWEQEGKLCTGGSAGGL